MWSQVGLGSITMNKASGCDRIPVELFQILKDDAVRDVLHSICQKIWKTQQWPQDWNRSVFIPIPKKGNPKECSNYRTGRPGVLWFTGWQRVGHDWATKLNWTEWVLGLPWWLRQWRAYLQCGRSGFDPWVGKIPWRRTWQPTAVLPGESPWTESLAGYNPWGRKGLDMCE